MPDSAAGLARESQATEPLASDLSGLRILLADDNQDALTCLADLLTFMGGQVATARDGEEAIRQAASFDPHVVLLDLGMPKLDGCEVARRLRQTGTAPRAILIALTGWGRDEDRLRTRAAGFDHHMVKPVDVAVLEALLDGLARSVAARRPDEPAL